MALRTIAGRDINVVEQGDGRPILFLHGNPLDHRSLLLRLGPVFAEHSGYQRIHLDLPGFGASPGDPGVHGSEGMLDVVIELVDALVGSDRLAIVAESWGAYLARGVVARRPEQIAGIALFCPVVIAARSDRDLPPHRAMRAETALLDDAQPEMAEMFRSVAVIAGAAQWKNFRDVIMPAAMSADSATLTRVEEAYGFPYDVDGVGEAFERPSLVVVGRQDSVVGYRDALRLIERLPRSTFVVSDTAGHGLLSERPELVAALVRDWLDRVDAEWPG